MRVLFRFFIFFVFFVFTLFFFCFFFCLPFCFFYWGFFFHLFFFRSWIFSFRYVYSLGCLSVFFFFFFFFLVFSRFCFNLDLRSLFHFGPLFDFFFLLRGQELLFFVSPM